MARFLQKRHPFNFYLMMDDIKHTVSEETARKLYLIWKENYQQPFIRLFFKQVNYDYETNFPISLLSAKCLFSLLHT